MDIHAAMNGKKLAWKALKFRLHTHTHTHTHTHVCPAEQSAQAVCRVEKFIFISLRWDCSSASTFPPLLACILRCFSTTIDGGKETERQSPWFEEAETSFSPLYTGEVQISSMSKATSSWVTACCYCRLPTMPGRGAVCSGIWPVFVLTQLKHDTLLFQVWVFFKEVSYEVDYAHQSCIYLI